MNNGSSSFFGGIARLGSFGQFIGFAGSAIVAVAATSIWATDYLRKIDSSDKRITELQAEVSRLSTELQTTNSRVGELTSKQGLIGERGPEGPAGPRGEKGERGEKGDSGADAASADLTSVRAFIAEELKKLPSVAANTTSGIAMAEINSDCTVLKPTDEKFRLVFKKGMTFCGADGELLTSVENVKDTFSQLILNNLGSGDWGCSLNERCQFDWLGSYSFHIEKMDLSNSQPQAIAIFQKRN